MGSGFGVGVGVGLGVAVGVGVGVGKGKELSEDAIEEIDRQNVITRNIADKVTNLLLNT